MAKCILMSIKPKYVSMILNKTKTIEVRKRFPSEYVGWVYIYCTKEKPYARRYVHNDKWGTLEYIKCDGKVVARFWCDKVEEVRPLMCGNFYHIEYGLTTNQFNDYLQGKKGYAIHITKLEIFDKPKEISEFYNYLNCSHSCFDCLENHYVKKCNLHTLTRAPQSYMFIEM